MSNTDSGVVSVRYMIEDVDAGRVKVNRVDDVAIAWDRRTFIKGLGLAVLTVQSLPLVACASRNPPSDGKEAVNNLIIQSSPGPFKHVHDLLIPYALLCSFSDQMPQFFISLVLSASW
jgi:hypothetical protein